MYDEIYDDKEDRKLRGVFYTPEEYVKISTEYVLRAISECSKDYIIVDRCCGTGNLESMFSREMLDRCILGTIDPEEAKVVKDRYNVEVYVGDALDRDGVLYYRKKILENKDKAIIFLENPPYFNVVNTNRPTERDSNGGMISGTTEKKYIKTYVHTLMPSRGMDYDEQFIWSALNIYKPFGYIHFGPVKSWKNHHIFDNIIKEAYICDMSKFGDANTSAVLLAYIGSDKVEQEVIECKSDNGECKLRKVHEQISSLLPSDDVNKSVCSIYISGNIGFYPRMHNRLEEPSAKRPHNISKEHLLESIPLWLVGYNYLTRIVANDYRLCVLTKSGDKGTEYKKDTEFLQDCLLCGLTSTGIYAGKKFIKASEELLDDTRKNSELYKFWKSLVKSTGKYRVLEMQKILGITHKDIKKLLTLNNNMFKKLMPKFLEYELLK